jgi:hypothetical protein
MRGCEETDSLQVSHPGPDLPGDLQSKVFALKTRNAGVVASGFHLCPSGHVLLKHDGNVAQFGFYGTSVALFTCQELNHTGSPQFSCILQVIWITFLACGKSRLSLVAPDVQ